MPSNLNIAIVGAHCATSELHGAAILASEGLKLQAICGYTRDEAAGLQKALAADTHVTDDFKQLLEDKEVEAMVMAGAANIYDLAEAALRAGKSVLFETPVEPSPQKFEALLEAEKLSEGTLALSYPLRFHPGHIEIAERVRKGEFGTLHCVRLHANAVTTAQGRGVLGSLGAQLVDQALWVVGLPSSSISNLTATTSATATGHETEISASWSYPNGPIVQLFCSNQWDSHPSVPASRIELHCKDAKIELLDTLGARRPGRVLIEDEELGFGKDSQFISQLADFAQALRSKQPPRCGSSVGTENALVLEQLFAQAETV